MDDEISSKAYELKQKILESDEYQRYNLYKEELDEYPELKRKIQEFRKKNFEFQLDNSQDKVSKAHKLLEEYKEVLENSMTSAYLNSELALCKQLQHVYKILNEDIDLELDFL